MNAHEGHRFAFLLLEVAVAERYGSADAAKVLGISGTTAAHFRANGMSAYQADKLACRIGLHPGEIFDDWAQTAPLVDAP